MIDHVDDETLPPNAVALILEELGDGATDRQALERLGGLLAVRHLEVGGDSRQVRGGGGEGLVRLAADGEVMRAAGDLDAVHGEHQALRGAVEPDDEEESLSLSRLVESVDRHAVDPVAVVALRLDSVELPQLPPTVRAVHREVGVVARGQRGDELHHQEPAVLGEDILDVVRDHDAAAVVDGPIDLEELGPIGVRRGAGPNELLVRAQNPFQFAVARLRGLDPESEFQRRVGVDLVDLHDLFLRKTPKVSGNSFCHTPVPGWGQIWHHFKGHINPSKGAVFGHGKRTI